MSKTLSKVMGLKANKKYLRFIIENGNKHGYLQFSGEALESPYTKFEVVDANNIGLVHIRCCYNNKYWVRSSADENFIVVGADEPQENKSKWSCTLFQLVYVVADSTVRFIYVQLENYLSFCKSATSPYYACLLAESATLGPDAYTFIDWETMLIFPKQIAFKGNSYYLSARTIDQNPYLQFVSSEIGDKTVSNEVFILSDGSIHIKSIDFAKFWRRNSSSNWIWTDSDDSTGNNNNTLFWSTKDKHNVVVLCNLGNKHFCTSKSLTIDKKCLNAAVPNSTTEANLVVEEVVTSRNIYNVEFCLKDTRIYCQKDITMASKVVENKTLQPCSVEVTLSYTDNKTGTWNGSVSLKLFVDITSIKSSIAIIDKVLEKSIVIISGDQFGGSYKWGKTIYKSTKLVETKVTVLVPASKKMKVSIVATQGTCDVPFSYSQYDTLMNGDKITYNMDDGIYTDTNCFNFRTVTEII